MINISSGISGAYDVRLKNNKLLTMSIRLKGIIRMEDRIESEKHDGWIYKKLHYQQIRILNRELPIEIKNGDEYIPLAIGMNQVDFDKMLNNLNHADVTPGHNADTKDPIIVSSTQEEYSGNVSYDEEDDDEINPVTESHARENDFNADQEDDITSEDNVNLEEGTKEQSTNDQKIDKKENTEQNQSTKPRKEEKGSDISVVKPMVGVKESGSVPVRPNIGGRPNYNPSKNGKKQN